VSRSTASRQAYVIDAAGLVIEEIHVESAADRIFSNRKAVAVISPTGLLLRYRAPSEESVRKSEQIARQAMELYRRSHPGCVVEEEPVSFVPPPPKKNASKHVKKMWGRT
jgi:hypothetical protein